MITRREVRQQISVVVLAIGAFMIATDARAWLIKQTGLPGWFLGTSLILWALYFYDQNGR